MASEQRQRVRFTGKRTGLESIAVKGIGRVAKGEQIEVSVEEADRFTAELPMRDDKVGSDFVTVGEPFKVDADEVALHEERQREKLAAKASDDAVEGETVEEFADDREVTDKAEAKKKS